MKILIIEDEFNLADVIATRLKRENYAVDICCDGETGLDNALTNVYDLIILDVMLPKRNGFEILSQLRKSKIHSKVIMLTAKTLLEDKLNGFYKGANDYVTKPFHIDELVARVNIQLRKDVNTQTIKNSIEAGDLRLNINTSNLLCVSTNESIDIICKEFLLMEYLMQNPNQIISKEQIYEKVWGIENESESNSLEAYLSFIRKKLKMIGSNVNIKAIRGVGYKLEVCNEKTKE
ncbi:MAG: response regulator transcription factor [Clostridia bacterium]|nr:response regulator transcription factor [Clostridia bacterium]